MSAMSEQKKQIRADCSTAGDDFRTRYDGVENIDHQQLEALYQLDRESKTVVSGVVRDGRLIAVQGRFPTLTLDPVAAAIEFLGKHEIAFGFDAVGEDNAFTAPRLIEGDEGSPRDVSSVFFAHHVQGVPTYRGGVAVGVDGAGSVRFVRALIPPPIHAPEPRDAAGARNVISALLSDGDLPDATFEVFDPALVFGESGKPVGVWVFDIRRGAPMHVLVQDGKDEVFHIVANPLLGVGSLPRYHLNRVTGAPDMVIFPGAGLLLPEACTRNPVAVARAVFERFPKLFGTGDPALQLALGDVLTGPDPQIPTTTVVFHQRWGALPVFGCQLRVHLSRALAVRSISGNFLRDPGIETTTPAVNESAARIAASTTAAFDAPVVLDIRHDRKVSAAPLPIAGLRAAISVSTLDRPAPTGSEPPYTARDARAAALRQATNYHRGVELDPQRALTMGVPGAEDRGLTILPTSLIRSGHERNHLTWWFRFPDSDRFISAATGASILTLPRIPTAERVFDAANATEPAAGVNPQFIDGNPQVLRTALDPDAQGAAGAVATVDSFWRIFHRDSWDGRGADMDAYVDWQDPKGHVAQWDGSRTMYSPQWATPDMVGHEFTHGLTQATAGLQYIDESGAANEHYSDLFGNLIFPDTPPTQWVVGENGPGGLLRDMRNPDVHTYQHYEVRQPTEAGDWGGVHRNSGILNRAAVLMCDGAPSAPLPGGIGRSRLARLAWETLVYRLHPFGSFSDILHLTWAVSLELAEAGSLGAPGIPAVSELPPAFDASVTDTVVWAFQQVGLLLDVQNGWHDVTVNTPFQTTPGTPGFWAIERLYPGRSLPNGQTLTDMEVRLFRRTVLNGSMLMSTGGMFNAPDGSFSARIVSDNRIGSANLETDVLIRSQTALTIALQGVLTIANPLSTIQQPVVTPLDTPRVAHWLDIAPFGRRYNDIVYEGAQLPVGCFVTNVELRVVTGFANVSDFNGNFGELTVSTTAVGVNIGNDHTGAQIVSRTLGGRSLEVKVHSWHDAYTCVRFVLRYFVAGNGCSLPPFTMREL